ncbi:hypothetical protein CJU89_3688 [Yarrowia sp. B02]|nr:hypothetical protein CJU89_3688 [Yarrowia sp. B02]
MSAIIWTGNIQQNPVQPTIPLPSVLADSVKGHSLSDSSVIKNKSVCDFADGSETTGKLFLPSNISVKQCAEFVTEALQPFKTKGAFKFETLIISIEGLAFSDEMEDMDTSADTVIALYKAAAQAAAKLEVVGHFGVCEFSQDLLEALLKSIEPEFKPVIDHINAADCCVLPPGLIKLSTREGIRLVAHHDPETSLSVSDLAKVGSELGVEFKRWDWILKLTAVIKDRQVLHGSEYVVKAVY